MFRYENSNTIFSVSTTYNFSRADEILLLNLASKHESGSARICLHTHQAKSTQNMIICLQKHRAFAAHYHPGGKSESYTVLRGKLYIEQLKRNGEHLRTIMLTSNNSPYMHQGMQIHRTYTLDEPCIYQEVYHGSFDKSKDVVYI